jgi:hypothetical protein
MLSKDISLLWQGFTKEQKRPFIELAEREKAEHKIRYPNYKFAPKSKEAKAAIREAERTTKARLKAQQSAAVQMAKLAAIRKYANASASSTYGNATISSTPSTKSTHLSSPTVVSQATSPTTVVNQPQSFQLVSCFLPYFVAFAACCMICLALG